MKKSLRQKTLDRQVELGIQPKRSLGQNFLISDAVVAKMLQTTPLAEFDHVVEIGPGLGALTDCLIDPSQQLTLIEYDKMFANFWREKGLSVIEKDALQVDWQGFDFNQKLLLISNLPYQISSRLVVELSIAENTFSEMILMFQKEVAQRFVARPKTADFGLLSVVGQSFWDIQFVLEAGSVDFMPKPKVASRVLHFKRRPSLEDLFDKRGFLSFLKLCFANPRKKLQPKLFSFLGKKQLSELFEQLDMGQDCRVAELSVVQLQRLYLSVKQNSKPESCS